MAKEIAILGSTGSIGKQTLQVIDHLGPEYSVCALAGNNNLDLLEAQTRRYRPKVVAVYDEESAREFARRVPGMPVVTGMEGLCQVATSGDVIVSAISGSIAIQPTLCALEAGLRVALANKEALVMAGELIMDTAGLCDGEIIPIDSEQSAIFQCLEGRCNLDVERLVLTASGGPFLGFTKEQLEKVTISQALQHPNWVMGPKNTIDSSTLMNKGLEVIEAHWLFNQPLDKIDVVIHPQSLVHGFIEFVDGSLLAQIAEPSMVIPIQYALTFPERKPGIVSRYDFKRFSKMEFIDPDDDTFICLPLAFEAARIGGSLPCFMNAVNEVLVERFVKGEISWYAIGENLGNLMATHKTIDTPNLVDLLEIDLEARRKAQEV